MFAPIPGRPRARKHAKITSLMPLHPNTRDNGKKSDPPRAEHQAPHTAAKTTPFLGKPSHLDHHDTVTHIMVGVQGRDYALQAPSDIYIVMVTQRALTYARHLFRHTIPAAEPRNLTNALAQLRIKYSRAEAERLAIADANMFQFTPAQTHRDIQEFRRLGSIEALIVHHNNKQKETGLNETRVTTHLFDDEQFPKILDIVRMEPSLIQTQHS